ncbi:MAG TPA: HAD family hydrolase [Anaerolineales bacterium]|nr:HAD family hydrolase [Anaerolineales bacterium]
MLSPNGIKAILFDLDGTLRHNQPQGEEVFFNYALSLDLPVNEDDHLRGVRWEHYYWASSPELNADLTIYSEDNFWVNYARRQLIAYGIEPKQAEQLAPSFSQHMSEDYKPFSVARPETHAVLSQLKEAGFKLGVVSNREHSFEEDLKHIGIESYFEFSLAAGEVQSYKPARGIFEAALRCVDVSAHEAMYVGDNYFADVVGARGAGLQPVLYDPSRIYPDADCPVIVSLDGLLEFFEK